jgi:hypothetical protein
MNEQVTGNKVKMEYGTAAADTWYIFITISL